MTIPQWLAHPHFSVFEVVMLVCFGLSWPFSIYRTWRAKNVEAKSAVFLVLVIVGYIAGIIHKLLHSRDAVILLYAANALMVAVDLLLVRRNKRRYAGLKQDACPNPALPKGVSR